MTNPFEEPAVASRYERWYEGPGRHADLLEKQLLDKLLCSFPNARSILEVGCGTGHFTRWMMARGLNAVGLDMSDAMLDRASALGGPQYLSGDAHSLPFADRSFDITALITTLEFLRDPALALAEAVRVARQGILLGALNRWSVLTLRYRLSGGVIWRSARFFGPGELGPARVPGGRSKGPDGHVANNAVARSGHVRFYPSMGRLYRHGSATRGARMKTVSIQMSLYPLRQPHLGPAISQALRMEPNAFRIRPGATRWRLGNRPCAPCVWTVARQRLR